MDDGDGVSARRTRTVPLLAALDERRAVTPLSAADDDAEALVLRLAPREPAALPGARYDALVLEGALALGNSADYEEHAFLRGVELSTSCAGPSGASVLLLGVRDVAVNGEGLAPLPRCERLQAALWEAGKEPGLRIAYVARRPAALLFVEWTAGAHVPAHAHPRGEDVLVLRGKLMDGEGVYEAGTWMRLPPGQAHALRALEPSLIFLQNGHLAPR